ncbi:hypothetical protein EV361DRAFT_784606, partial [Lentinula raphanica]
TLTSAPSAKRKRAPASSKRVSKARSKSAYEEDDDDYDDNDSGNDDEYAPSPPLAPKSRKQRQMGRARQHRTKRPTPTPSGASHPRIEDSHTPAKKRQRMAPESRNLQSDSPELLEAIANTCVETCDFMCPVCDWEQVNKRMPDYQRHLRTHLRPDRDDKTRGWWCKGVRVEERDRFDARCMKNHVKRVADDAEPYWFHDHMRIGGCCQTFSRRDALKRHIANPNVRCMG